MSEPNPTPKVDMAAKALDPNTDPATLVVLAMWWPSRVLENPALPLLSLENPTAYAAIVAASERALFEDRLKDKWGKAGAKRVARWLLGVLALEPLPWWANTFKGSTGELAQAWAGYQYRHYHDPKSQFRELPQRLLTRTISFKSTSASTMLTLIHDVIDWRRVKFEVMVEIARAAFDFCIADERYMEGVERIKELERNWRLMVPHLA